MKPSLVRSLLLGFCLSASFGCAVPVWADDAATHMGLAQKAADAGDLDKAAAELDAALLIEPNNTKALTGRAMVYAGKKDFKGAVKSLSRLLELEPNNLGALQMRAAMFHQLGDAASSDKDVVSVLRLSDDAFKATKIKAQQASDKGDWPTAFRAWDLLAQARPQDAASLFGRGVAGLQLHPRTSLFEDQNTDFLEQKKKSEADFDAALKADPTFVAVDIFRANQPQRSLMVESDKVFGIALLTKSLERLPDNPDLLAARADLEQKHATSLPSTDPEKAATEKAMMDDYSRALVRDPKNFAARLGRANATYLAQPNSALGDLNAALLQRPDDADALQLRAHVFAFKNDFPAAVADYDRLFELYPKLKDGLEFDQLLALRRLPDTSRALTEINHLIAQSPDNALYLSLRAEIFFAQKDLVHALADINKALELRPNDKGYAQTRDQILAAQKTAEKAP